jgi:alkylation response protein AidB-like acyl-CoA dehydrogenase
MRQDSVRPTRRQLLRAIAARAAEADSGAGTLQPDLADLADAGWLACCLPGAAGGEGWGCEPAGTGPAFEALRDLGRASLPVARLFEGHMNAVKLVSLYAARELREETFAAVREGVVLGVWGADEADHPLRRTEAGVLSGAKRFASGLDMLGRVVVTLHADAAAQLAIVPCDDPERADAGPWTMAGMKATRSGRYDFTGVLCPDRQLLGKAGDYYCEPHFEGGIWRYCAAHLGAGEALFDAFRDALVARGRQDDPHQRDRIANAATALESARLFLLRAALEVEAPDAPPGKAALSLFARELTEQSCRTVLSSVEQGLGMAAHDMASPIERVRRDLSLFLCQAAPDAKRQRAAAALIDLGTRIEHL